MQPTTTFPYLHLSATEMAQLLREKKVSPVALVQAHIAYIDKINPKLHAVVATNYGKALELAKQAEERYTKEDPHTLPPFLGVPCSIKDTFALQGLTWTAGSWYRKNKVADCNADMVEHYLNLGFIPLVKTNVPEGGMWTESYNHVYGRTYNAYHSWHTAGGSSGGEASLIGAGGVPVGLGSDIGGSIRMPCSFNGIAGHKATSNLTQETQHWPEIQSTPLARFCAYGPMAKSVQDVIQIFESLPQLQNKPKASSVSTQDLIVYYYEEFPDLPASKEVKQHIRRVISVLQKNGHQTIAINTDLFRQAFLIWNTLINQLGPNFSKTLGGGTELSLLSELLEYLKLKPRVILPNLLQVFFSRHQILQGDLTLLQGKLNDLKVFLTQILEQNAVLLAPTYPTIAPLHYWPLIANQHFSYAGIYNVLGNPATAVNIGFSRINSLPIGVQIVAQDHQDHLCLAMAQRLENLLGGWTPPLWTQSI